eukprot:TRINITY_DN1004_c0_g1_i2.p1 TRINITY_DN1004_c0_g1~~TRINITY_DN1004_c0_g1_i2.p1  ORF type:complete len:332 (+),score=54.16 TRINITY_DN1004_c0_g1_i2:82-996(+)
MGKPVDAVSQPIDGGAAAARPHGGTGSAHQSAVAYTPCQSFAGVFQALLSNRVNVGILPLENSVTGRISDVVNSFFDPAIAANIRLSHEIYLKIPLCIMSNETHMKKISTVYTQPQIAEQCRKYLSRVLPDARVVECASPAEAASVARDTPNSCAIASRMAADQYGLQVLDNLVTDIPTSVTRFVVISKHFSPPSDSGAETSPSSPIHTEDATGVPTGNDVTVLTFGLTNHSGSLSKVLNSFTCHGINLLCIQSFPTSNSFEYHFYVELEGHILDEPVKKAMAATRQIVSFLHVLGSLPSARGD